VIYFGYSGLEDVEPFSINHFIGDMRGLLGYFMLGKFLVENIEIIEEFQ
jgi:hypothetical protein